MLLVALLVLGLADVFYLQHLNTNAALQQSPLVHSRYNSGKRLVNKFLVEAPAQVEFANVLPDCSLLGLGHGLIKRYLKFLEDLGEVLDGDRKLELGGEFCVKCLKRVLFLH